MISRVKLYSYWLWWSRFNFKVWYIDRLKPDLNIVAFERYNWKLMAYQCCCTVVTRLSLMTQQCSSPLQLVDNCVYTLLQLDGWSGSSPVTAPWLTMFHTLLELDDSPCLCPVRAWWLTMFISCYSSMTDHVYTLLQLHDSPCLYPVRAWWLTMFHTLLELDDSPCFIPCYSSMTHHALYPVTARPVLLPGSNHLNVHHW